VGSIPTSGTTLARLHSCASYGAASQPSLARNDNFSSIDARNVSSWEPPASSFTIGEVQRARLALIGELSLVLIVFSLLFALHSRWIYTHFSSDAYLEDSGWLAYLFESRDPLLRNPSAENNLSFYAHHLSPHIFLFGAPLSKFLHFDGFRIFAWHQGLFFGLFFVAVYSIVTASGMRRTDRAIAGASAVLLGAFANALFQAAGYPHQEIAMMALVALAIGGWLRHLWILFAACLLWLPLVREDGGFYVAVVTLSCLALEADPQPRWDHRTRVLLALTAAGLIASACSFLIKAWFFPGWDAFAQNFAGGKQYSPEPWGHLSAAFALRRTGEMLRNLNVVPVLVASAVLAAFDKRYVAGLVLLSPIYLIHLLAFRESHGHFALYFALPWLVPCAIWLAVFTKRSSALRATRAEAFVILAAAVVLSAPFQAAVGARGESFYVARWAFQRPVVDIRAMQGFIRWAKQGFGATGLGPNQKQCFSQGIAALVPNDIRAEEVLTPDTNLHDCQMIVLLRGEVFYGDLSSRNEAAGFRPMKAKDNAEVWVAMSGNR
jgi:hypothetical protein